MAGELKIMLVDSDQKAALLVAAALRKQGWDVVFATDAVHALNMAVKQKPAAVVLGTQLPGGGGLNVLKKMRTNLYTADTPVIAVTGPVGPQREELLAAGAQECMEQPVDTGALCAAIRKCLAHPPVIMAAPADVLRAPERLAALEETGLLDSAPNELLDRITWLAVSLLGVPTALVSLVGSDRQFFKSQIGVADPWATSRETPLSHSFCQWVVAGREAVVVADAREHPVLRSNLAIRDLGVIAYAGVPLSAGADQKIGSFCAIDSIPRSWSADDLATLRDLALVTEAYVALGRARQATAESVPATIRSDADAVAVMRAGANGMGSAARILRQRWHRLTEPEREALFEIVETLRQNLIQVTGGLE